MSTTSSYPSWEDIKSASDNTVLGMQIILDTYTQRVHNNCVDTYSMILNGPERELTNEEKTWEIYIEIVLTLRETWQPILAAFRKLKEDRLAETTARTASTMV